MMRCNCDRSAYLLFDPSSKVTVLPLTVSLVPEGDVKENSYNPF